MVMGTDMPDSPSKWFWLALTIIAALSLWSFNTAMSNQQELAIRAPIIQDTNNDINDLFKEFIDFRLEFTQFKCSTKPSLCE
jgi:hypothetical protein